MKKLLFLAPTADFTSGATRALLATIRYAKVAGYQPLVICPGSGELRKEAQKIGSIVYTVNFDWWVRPKFETDKEYGKNSVANGLAIQRIIEIIEKENPFACLTCTVTSPWLAYAAAMTGKPHIWHIYEHVIEPSPTFNYRLKLKDVLKTIDLLSDQVFAVSDSVKDRLISDLPSFSNIETLYPYVPPLQERSNITYKNLFRNGAFKIVLVGAVVENKGQLDAVKAVHQIIQTGEDVNLLLIGGQESTKYVNQIRKYIKDNKLSKDIKLIGFINNPLALLEAADISLSCSSYDAFPLTVIESLQLRTPVIASRSGGSQEILKKDGLYGLLYQPGNVDELADKIRSLILDRNLLELMGSRALQYIESNFSSLDKVHKPLHKYLNKLEANPRNLESFNLAPLKDLDVSAQSTNQEVKLAKKRQALTDIHVRNLEAELTLIHQGRGNILNSKGRLLASRFKKIFKKLM